MTGTQLGQALLTLTRQPFEPIRTRRLAAIQSSLAVRLRAIREQTRSGQVGRSRGSPNLVDTRRMAGDNGAQRSRQTGRVPTPHRALQTSVPGRWKKRERRHEQARSDLSESSGLL